MDTDFKPIDSMPELTGLMSSYLQDDWRRERFEVVRFGYLEGRELQFSLRGRDMAPDESGEPHLSALQMFCWVQQMAIVAICLDNRTTKNDLGEVYLTKFELACRKPIRTEVIDFTLALEKKTQRLGKLFYSGRYSVESDRFRGQISAIVNAPVGAVPGIA